MNINTGIAKEQSKQNNSYKESLQVEAEDLEKNTKQTIEQKNIEKEVNELKNEKEVLQFLKNMYIEQYEKMTGDATLTTEDIKMYYPTYQSYVFINDETGEIITHGEAPNETRQKIENDNVSYSKIYNVKVYKVTNQEGKIIDCITLQSENGKMVPKKVTIGSQYSETYDSALAEMGTIVPYGLTYADSIERKDERDMEVAKVQFIAALKEFKNSNNTKEKVNGEERE